MKKKFLFLIIAVVLCLSVILSGCEIFGSVTDRLANNAANSADVNSPEDQTDENSETEIDSNADGYISEDELQAALASYQNTITALLERLNDSEDALDKVIQSANTGIGSYANTLIDSVMNITCVEEQYGLGCTATGFIISDDGYVITNNHVVYYEEQIITGATYFWYNYRTISGEYSDISAIFDENSIYYQDGKNYTLQFVYRDANTDLALLKLTEECPTEDDDGWKNILFYQGEITIGEDMLVLGNAAGLGMSATVGVVSATHKSFSDYPDLYLIQTDTAINGGNSGGPAVNIYGALIGVVNSKLVSSEIENIGFAIELDIVTAFIDAAENAKSITVNYEEFTPSAT